MSNTVDKLALESALEDAVKKLKEGVVAFNGKFPDAATKKYKYPKIRYGTKLDEWTSGFWTGMLWLAYEMTHDESLRTVAESHLDHFEKRIDRKYGVNHHDLGFLYILATTSNFQITGSARAKEVSLKAADHLITRYKEKGGFIQAWGDINNPKDYRLIIDCMMNIPLLFWATDVTGNPVYREIAENHAKATANVILRPDGSTFHTFYFDPETGAPERGATAQGYADNSPWARGQAWGIYGFALAYGYTKDPMYLEKCFIVTDFFLEHLPEDSVCYWDLCFTDGSGEERDTSAAAIAVCGLFELLQYMSPDDSRYKTYQEAADNMMVSLMTKYTTKDMPKAQGLLKEGVYSKPGKNGVNEANLWGDYFYLEAIVRYLKKDWNRYW